MIKNEVIVLQKMKPLCEEYKNIEFQTKFSVSEEHYTWERDGINLPIEKPKFKKIILNFKQNNSDYLVTFDIDAALCLENAARSLRFFNNLGRYFEFLFWEDGVHELRYWDSVHDYRNEPNKMKVIEDQFFSVTYIPWDKE